MPSISETIVTLLAKKADAEVPLAKNDDHQTSLEQDPTITQFSAKGGASYMNNRDTVTYQPTVLTTAGSNAAEGADILVSNDKQSEHWINTRWRPAMGWLYFMVCLCDFVIFPVAWSILQALTHGQVNSQWQPLTLQGAGLFHLAMGAVLGVAAYGRTKEKVANAT